MTSDFDESPQEWAASLMAWDNSTTGSQFPTNHYPVDFRNSYQWGVKGL